MSYSRFPFIGFVIILVVGLPTGSFSQDTNANADKIQVLQKQLDEMKSQMASVQAQITELSGGKSVGKQASADEHTGAAEAAALNLVSGKQEVSQATATYQTNSQDEVAAPRVDNAPLDPRFPGYFRLPGTRTMLKIGGYFKSDFIYDLKPAGDAERFIPATFPIPTPPGVNNTTVSIRPTRLNLDFLIPVSSTSVRFFIEGDLFGSSATTPRLRHAYAQVKNLLIGQSFSNFQDPDAGPDTLDFQGPNSQVSIRNPQLRYTFKLAEKSSFSVSVEKASSDVVFKTPQFSALPNSPSPDGTVKFRQEMSFGHFQLSALFRSPAAYLPNGKNESVFGWGINASGAIKVFGRDMLVYQGAYGAGMERYVNDSSGQGIDAAPTDAARPHLKAVPLTAVYAGFQHYWLKQLRSSAVYGFAQVENTDLEPGGDYHKSHYSAVNLIWNPFGSLNVGAEYLYGWVVEKSGATANAPRIMFSAKYSFIKAMDKGL
jgi:hypothetical protein